MVFPFAATSSLFPLQAQNAFEPLEIEEVVVTESRYSNDFDDTDEDFDSLGRVSKSNQVTSYLSGTPLVDVPQSITVVTADQIQKQGIDSVGDLVEYTPGVTTSQGEGHRDAVVFRGVRSTADFFADGVRDDVQYYRSLYNVDQVEVIKGPNALTFGRGGIGGVLNRSFKRAEVGRNFGGYQTSVDTFGAYGGQFDLNYSPNDWAAVRLNAHYDHVANQRDFYNGDRLGVNPTFTFKLGEDTDLRLSYEYANHERFIDRGIPSTPNGIERGDPSEPTGSPAAQFDGVTFGDSSLNSNQLEAHTFRVVVDHKFNDDWKGTIGAYYGTFDKVYSNYFASDFDGDRLVELDGYIDRTDRQRFSLSGNVVGEFSTGPVDHKVLFGGEYIRTNSDQDRVNNVWASNGEDRQSFDVADGFTLQNGIFRNNAGTIVDTGTLELLPDGSNLNDDTSVVINVYSAFLQDEIALSEHWDVILGARFDSFDIDVDDNAPGGERLGRTDTRVTPRFGLVYKPIESVSLYGSYSETFLPRSGEQFSDLGGGADALEADTASNLEFGAKWDINDSFTFTASYFYIDQRSTDADTANAGSLVQIDSQIFGGEAQLQGNINEHWFISIGYTFLEGDQSEGNLRLRELPKNSASLWTNVQVTEALSVGMGITYQDKSFVDNANTIELPSFARVDASARYDFSENFGVQLNIENILDNGYFPNAHNDNNISVSQPVSARLSFVGRF